MNEGDDWGARPGMGRPGAPSFGTWVKLASLETVEAIARAGFDFIAIDLEHSPLTLESVYASMVVAQAQQLSVLVRVSDRSGSQVQRLLDAGADGLIIPQVPDARAAADAVSRMRFAPEGTRGFGVTSRAGGWGITSRSTYLAHAERGLTRCVQLENREALDDVDPILDTPGLTAVLIGLADLTLSTGLAADDPAIIRWTRHVLAGARDRGIACGTAVATPAAARAAADDGFSFILVGNDIGLFAVAAKQVVDDLHAPAAYASVTPS